MGVFQILAIVFFGLAFVGLVITIILFFNLEIVSVIGDLSGLTAKKQIEMIREQTTNISYGSHKRTQSRNSANPIDNVLVNSTSDSLAKAKAHDSKRLRRGQTGDTARQGKAKPAFQSEKLREFQASPGGGTVSLDSINKTDTLKSGRTGKLQKQKRKKDLSEEPTDVLSTNTSELPTDVLSSNATELPTDVLSSDSELPTDVLSSNTTELPTDVLSDDYEQQTTVLSDDTGETTVLSDDTGGTTVLSDDAGETTVLNNESEGSAGFKIISDETVINTDEVIEN